MNLDLLLLTCGANCLLLPEAMGNSSSHSTLPHEAADRKKCLATEAVNRADMVTDEESPSTNTPQNSFCSRLLVRNGEKLVCKQGSIKAGSGCAKCGPLTDL